MKRPRLPILPPRVRTREDEEMGVFPSLKRMHTVLYGVLLLLAVGSPPLWAQSPPPAPSVSARAVELVDATSGQVLYAKNPQEELPMASVTKLMTLYLAVRAIERHKISLQNMVPADESAYRIGGSQIWLEPGERLSVDQMMKAIAIGSANDAAYALGSYIGGSESAFVDQMNQTAKQLGMTHTHFSNPHGLPQAGHYSSAHDLALLGEQAARMPLLLHYTSMWEDRSIRNGKGGSLWLVNHNRLIRSYPGADGLKTGFTSQAGYCLVATAKRGANRLVVAILGAPSGKVRSQDAEALMNWGFQNFRTVSVAHAHKIMGYVHVRRGVEANVPAEITRTVALTLPIADGPVTSGLKLADEVPAPVRKGETLGQFDVSARHSLLRRIPVVASRSVPATTIGKLGWRYFWKMFG